MEYYFNKNKRHKTVTGLILFILVFLGSSSLIAAPPGKSGDEDLNDIGKTWFQSLENGEGDPEKKADTEQAENPENPSGSADPGRALFTPPDQEAPSFLSVVLRFLLMMGGMVGGLYLLLNFIKKRQMKSGPGGGPVEVLLSSPIHPGKHLQVVDLAGKLMVLGVSEQGVNLLMDLEEGPVADRLRLWHSTRPAGVEMESLLGKLGSFIREGDFRFWATEGRKGDENRESFRSNLQQAINPGSSGEPEDDGQAITEILKKQKKRISRMKKGSRGPDETGDDL